MIEKDTRNILWKDFSMERLLQDTIEITRAAGDIIMEYYGSCYDVKDKSPDNPVTEADLAADRFLKQKLTSRLPKAGWLSEETDDRSDRLKKEQVWIVDPLDGTKEFIMGIPEFSVSVALVEDGSPVMGVIYNPAAKELFHCTFGGNVFLNGRQTNVTDRRNIESSKIDASRSE